MGIVHENTNFHGSETDSAERKTLSTGRGNWGTKKGSTGFSSAPKTHATYGTCSHVAIARLSCLIVNKAAGCYSHGQALGYSYLLLHSETESILRSLGFSAVTFRGSLASFKGSSLV